MPAADQDFDRTWSQKSHMPQSQAMAGDKLWVAGVELAQPASPQRKPLSRGRRLPVADPSHPALLPVFGLGEKTQNATNEAKTPDNPVIAEVSESAEVTANSSPTPRLDKRAIEAKKRGSSPYIERRVPNRETEVANPCVNSGPDKPTLTPVDPAQFVTHDAAPEKKKDRGGGKAGGGGALIAEECSGKNLTTRRVNPRIMLLRQRARHEYVAQGNAHFNHATADPQSDSTLLKHTSCDYHDRAGLAMCAVAGTRLSAECSGNTDRLGIEHHGLENGLS
jgi:hypothetical protein